MAPVRFPSFSKGEGSTGRQIHLVLRSFLASVEVVDVVDVVGVHVLLSDLFLDVYFYFVSGS